MKRLGHLVVLGVLVASGCQCGTPDATIDSIAVSPLSTIVDAGGTATFTASASWTDGTVTDISADATWTSSDPAIATVDASGLATGVAVGSAGIQAEYQGFDASAGLTVNDPRSITSIAVTPAGPLSVAISSTTALTAIATYDDGSTGDVTRTGTWISSDTVIATVSLGNVSALAAGTTQVMVGVGVIDGNAVDFTVTAPVTLASIDVTPGAVTIDIAETHQFTAMGTYSDTTTADVTATVTWASDATGVADVDAAGLASGVAVGSAVITASLSGITSNDANVTVLTAVPTPGPGDLRVNEFLADGSLNQDANGDGTIDATEDEFLEIVNVSGGVLDLDGVVIKENQFPGLPRHTFGTLRLADGEAVVIFGGGDAPADTAGVFYQIANAPDPGIPFGLALSDTGDTVTLEDAGGTVILTLAFGGTTGIDANVDESLTLDPDVTGGAFVTHTTATGSGGAPFSPGARIDGTPFP